MKNENQKEKVREEPTIPAAGLRAPDGTIAEMVYDPNASRTAFAVSRGASWSLEPEFVIGTERFVPFSTRSNLIRCGTLLLPSVPEEYGDEETLLTELRAYIHRYVDVSPEFEQLACYYVLLSWLYDAFNELPYLRLRGDYGSGKTRCLLVIGAVCYRPFFASGASTISPIFHTLDAFRGTLVMDEGDFRFTDEKAEITKILNNGNVKGMPVLRTVVGNKGQYDVRAFQVFGPKLMATRGHYDDQALESRFLTEEMGTRRLRDDIPINLPSTYEDEARHLRNMFLLYRFRNLDRAGVVSELPDGTIEPRLNQIFLPLISVVADPTAREALRATARQYHDDIIADRAMEVEAQLLEAIRDLGAGRTSIPLKDISLHFARRFGTGQEQRITSRWVGTVVRRQLGLRTRKSHGSFVVHLPGEERLGLLYRKYGVNEGEPSARVDRVDLGDFTGGATPRTADTQLGQPPQSPPEASVEA